MNVVLPAPFGPMIAWLSPSTIWKSTRLVAMSPPKLFVRPRTSSSASAIAAALGQPADEPALREEHDEQQDRPEDHLPVRRPRGEHVLEQEQRDGADDGTDERPHPAEDDHEH